MQASVLTGGYIQRSVLADTASHALTSAVSLVPFVALVLLRYCEPHILPQTSKKRHL